MSPSAVRTALMAPLVLVVAATSAFAGTATFPDGRTEKMAADKEITGPAVVTTDDGTGTIRLRPGAVLRSLGDDKGKDGSIAEMFFLKSGAAHADLGHYSRVSTPAFWVFAEKKGDRTTCFVKSTGPKSGYARVVKSEGVTRLVVGQVGTKPLEALLFAGQGIHITRGENGAVGFRTDADNEWLGGTARLLYPAAGGGHLDLYIPKGTDGEVSPVEKEPAGVRLGSFIGSWHSGSIDAVWIDDGGKPGTTYELRSGESASASRGRIESTAIACGSGSLPNPALARESSNRRLRRGTFLLDGRVEVVGLNTDFVGTKPTLEIVLEHIDHKAPKEPIADLRWRVEFLQVGGILDGGAALREPRPVKGSLGMLGERVTIVVEGLDPALDLAGAWPVLHLTR